MEQAPIAAGPLEASVRSSLRHGLKRHRLSIADRKKRIGVAWKLQTIRNATGLGSIRRSNRPMREDPGAIPRAGREQCSRRDGLRMDNCRPQRVASDLMRPNAGAKAPT